MLAPAAQTILVIDDDPIVRELVAAFLRGAGMTVIEAGDAAAGLAAIAAAPIDLALVDINLPDASGLELADTLQQRSDCAVIFLTSLGHPDDRVRGLDRGDDYVVKPVDMRELRARVGAVLRRHGRGRAPEPATRPQVIDLGRWTLDLVRRELADAQGRLVRLTRAEFDLFAALVQAHGQSLDRDYLVEVVASADAATRPRTIDVMVSRIRRKLAQGGGPAPWILTSPGLGYRFEPAPAGP